MDTFLKVKSILEDPYARESDIIKCFDEILSSEHLTISQKDDVKSKMRRGVEFWYAALKEILQVKTLSELKLLIEKYALTNTIYSFTRYHIIIFCNKAFAHCMWKKLCELNNVKYSPETGKKLIQDMTEIYAKKSGFPNVEAYMDYIIETSIEYI